MDRRNNISHLDATSQKRRLELIQEINDFASKPEDLDDSEKSRFKFAMHKLDALLESRHFNVITISPGAEEIFNEEIEQFSEVLQSGKKYKLITIEIPKVISEESVMQLKSLFAEIKNSPDLVLRNSIPPILIDSLTVFQQIQIGFTDNEVAERTLINLNRSNSLLDLPSLILYFEENCEWRSTQIPKLLAELFEKLATDVSCSFLYCFLIGQTLRSIDNFHGIRGYRGSKFISEIKLENVRNCERLRLIRNLLAISLVQRVQLPYCLPNFLKDCLPLTEKFTELCISIEITVSLLFFIDGTNLFSLKSLARSISRKDCAS